MFGAGRPPPHGKPRRDWCALALVLFLLVGSKVASGEEVELQLRASWGGGAAARWQGSISLANGEVQIDRILGLEADAPGATVESNRGTIAIIPRIPRTYDGIDFTVRAARDTVLRFQFAPATNSQKPITFEATLEQLIEARVTRDLDATGNRFAIHRHAGDQLQFVSERDHLVFAGGETLRGKIVPHFIAAAASSTARCVLRLVSSATKNVPWQQEVEVKFDEFGSATPIDLEVPLPDEEGSYDLFVELSPKWFAAPLVRTKMLAERQVQLVVVQSEQTESAAKDWAVTGEFDPAHPNLWDRMMRLPTMKIVPGLKPGPLGSEQTGTREGLGITWSTLSGGAWQAYPLPVSEVGLPHLLEIEFPNDVSQSLGISILEPNAAGLIAPLGLDSGIEVTGLTGGTPKTQTHKLVFWPRTKSPLMLLTNRRDSSTAVFGKVRVLAGPTRLTELPTSETGTNADQRLVAAYFHKPLFPENFSVSESVDSRTNRPIDDWPEFHAGSRRLADYLKFSGHNAAVVSVLCEGSTLYPSQLLRPTPRYDLGNFASLASDPARKDVLELLLRIFNREHLQLIPLLDFSSPLPELELQLQGDPREVVGIELLTPEGRRWHEAHPNRRGAAPYYNLLDPRVQAAMRHVVVELAERYRHHTAMEGIAIQLSGEGYAQLPDEACGLDIATLTRFAADTHLKLPPLDPRRPAARWEWIEREARDAWLTWRAEQVTRFYRSMQNDLSEINPRLQLILCPVEPIASRSLEACIRPQLPTQDRALQGLLQIGIDPAALAKIPGITLVRSRSWQSQAAAELKAVQAEWNGSTDLNRSTAAFATPAALNLVESLPLRLEAFDKQSPFGAANTHTFLLSQLAATGSGARKRFITSLAATDTHLLFDGGSMLTLGQEEETRGLLQTLRTLPAAPFVEIPSNESKRTQPVVLRRWSDKEGTWLYLVNDSPWPVLVDLDLETTRDLSITRLGLKSRQEKLSASNGVAHWKVRLEPYDLVAGRIATSEVVVQSWQTQVDRAVDLALREQIRDVRLRANLLRSPTPLDSLANASFETTSIGRGIPHWSSAEAEGIKLEVDRQTSKHGGASLHVVSKSPITWIRSETIPTPQTGRLALWVWLKVPDANHQPKLRLAIEGRLEGQTYYRRANVGASEDKRGTQPIKEEWSPFVFPIDDLPTQGLTDLQIGFDLMGPGEVWIDDIQIYDLWFQEVERDSLLKSMALADFHIQEGKVADSLHYLDSYWPTFLRRHVSLESTHVAALPPAVEMPTPTPEPIPKAPAKNGVFDGVRRWVPRLPFTK